MDALRQSLKDIKSTLEKVSILKPLLSQCKPFLTIGCILWILGGLIPDTAHFAATFFSSLGRAALLIGLFFAFVQEEDRFIMITSVVVSVGAFIIIIIELAAPAYLSSFETYIYLILFCALAVNTSMYIKRKSLNDQPEDKKPAVVSRKYLSQISPEEQTAIHIETIPDEPPMIYEKQSEQPAKIETPLQSAPSANPKPASEPIIDNKKVKTSSNSKQSSPGQFEIHRAPSIGSAPSVGPAPSVGTKPKA